jgi:hypothetical protein
LKILYIVEHRWLGRHPRSVRESLDMAGVSAILALGIEEC